MTFLRKAYRQSNERKRRYVKYITITMGVEEFPYLFKLVVHNCSHTLLPYLSYLLKKLISSVTLSHF